MNEQPKSPSKSPKRQLDIQLTLNKSEGETNKSELNLDHLAKSLADDLPGSMTKHSSSPGTLDLKKEKSQPQSTISATTFGV